MIDAQNREMTMSGEKRGGPTQLWNPVKEEMVTMPMYASPTSDVYMNDYGTKDGINYKTPLGPTHY